MQRWSPDKFELMHSRITRTSADTPYFILKLSLSCSGIVPVCNISDQRKRSPLLCNGAEYRSHLIADTVTAAGSGPKQLWVRSCPGS
jgi:hypothetical protein